MPSALAQVASTLKPLETVAPFAGEVIATVGATAPEGPNSAVIIWTSSA